MPSPELSHEAFGKIPNAKVLSALLTSVDCLRYALKDREHRYLEVNEVWLETFAYASADRVIGKTAIDLFPAWRAKRYLEEERQVMEECLVLDYEEYLMDHEGTMQRWRTIKAPWIEGDEVKGYVNLGIRLSTGVGLEVRADTPPEMVTVLAARACEPVSLKEIALELGISSRTMERRFLNLMRETPAHFRMRCRMSRAKSLLRKNIAVSEVAHRCGFNDQSHFSKVFFKEEGISPKKFQIGFREG